MTTAVKPLPDHGTLSRYKYHRCRCNDCRDFYSSYQRTRYRKQAYGTWQPFVDAEPVRQHLLTLHAAGLSYQVIAERLGRHTPSITAFIYDQGPKRPRRKRATPELATAILALQPGDMPPAMIDATGTVRRIHALAAIGWPMQTLAPHVGVAKATINRITRQQWVFRPTADGVARTYESLRDQRPEDHGVTPGAAIKTRNHAARNRWRDPLWWDDMGGIDDPTFDPDTAERELSEREEQKLRLQEIRHLARFGLDPEEIRSRVGGDLTARYVKDIVKEVRTGKKRDRSKKPVAA